MPLAIIPQVNNIIINPEKLFAYELNKIAYVVNPSLHNEGYKILTSKAGITIEYASARGKRYGQNTLEQLLAIYPNEIPELTINDYPKYAHRGFMIDCSRHFFTVTEIKKQIAVMALLKLNIFHWHLTDDQGWRIEIKKFPLLTECGAKRLQTRNDKTEVGGYYTQDEIKEIVLFCQTRGIDVIPEIDMPGHFTAACSAYPELLCTRQKVAVAEHLGFYRTLPVQDETLLINFVMMF